MFALDAVWTNNCAYREQFCFEISPKYHKQWLAQKDVEFTNLSVETQVSYNEEELSSHAVLSLSVGALLSSNSLE